MTRPGYYLEVMPVLLVALMASGAAGLIYQICWIRSATLVVGSTTQAIGVVLATFFGGLALGSALFGRIASRTANPVRLYAILELGIAILGVCSLFAFGIADALLTQISRTTSSGAAITAAEFGVLAAILTPAAVLMGGTLPLFCRRFIDDSDHILPGVSWLYAVNTFGAAAGCLLAGLYLIPAVGIRASIVLAAILNVAAAAIAWRAPAGSRSSAPSSGRAKPEQPARAATGRPAVLMAVLFFLTGAVALANEVLWTRFAVLLVAGTVTTYTVTIAIVLVGIAAGSVAVARTGRPTTSAFWFGALQAGLAVWVIAVVHLPPAAWEALGPRVWMYLLLFLPPSIISGASFPLAVRIVTNTVDDAPATVGRMGAANMAGGIAGALGAALLLPSLGLELSLRATTALSLLAAWVAWLLVDTAAERQGTRIILSVAAGIAWVAIARFSPTRIPDDFLTRNGVLVDVREGEHSNLALSRSDGVLVLTSDHWWQGQDEKSHQIMAAHVPMLLHPAPRDVLVIGVGAGQTPARFTMYDIDRLDAVDIDPVVFEMVRQHFDARWMDDSRVRVLADDGRTVVQRTADQYDVVSIEVGQLLRPGVGAFYTKEFYERVRERLNAGGIVSQFVPLSFLTPAEFKNVVRTFIDVFPQTMLWYNRTEPLLIGTTGASLRLEPARLSLLERPGSVRDDLQFSLWGGAAQAQNQPPVFIAGFLTGADGLAALARGGEVYTDDRPILEYRAGQVLPPERSEFPILQDIIATVQPISAAVGQGTPPELMRQATEVRARHLQELTARTAIGRSP